MVCLNKLLSLWEILDIIKYIIIYKKFLEINKNRGLGVTSFILVLIVRI